MRKLILEWACVLFLIIIGIVWVTLEDKKNEYPNFNKEFSHLKDEGTTIDCKRNQQGGNTCHVTFNPTFDDNIYKDLIYQIQDNSFYNNYYRLLFLATSRDIIITHLQGHGGIASAGEAIINGIKNTKAKTINLIEGYVYSAHAMIAVAAQKVAVEPATIFLFHIAAVDGEPCSWVLPGALDRGTSAYDKCIQLYKGEMRKHNDFIQTLLFPYLTNFEMKHMLKGYNIIIQRDEMIKRLKHTGQYMSLEEYNGII